MSGRITWVTAEDVKALADNMEATLVHLNALASETATAGKVLEHLTPTWPPTWPTTLQPLV